VHIERKLKGWKYLAEFDVEKRALGKDWIEQPEES
jgi:hypothetical protein